ncbi:hypothetical protein BIW11_10737, partial [Tropilaelaps mercedesae]
VLVCRVCKYFLRLNSKSAKAKVDPSLLNRPLECAKTSEGELSVLASAEPLGDPGLRLSDMIKIHHLKTTSPFPSHSDDISGRTRLLRQPKHYVQEDTPKEPLEFDKQTIDLRKFIKVPPSPFNSSDTHHNSSEKLISESDVSDHPSNVKGYSSKTRQPPEEFYLTELDGPTSNPVQPPIIRAGQNACLTMNKWAQTCSTSSDKKVSFN